MPEVIRLEDTNDLVPTSKYKLGSWDFDTFNPVQSRLIETFDSKANIAIAAATSAGKAQPLSANILTPHGFVRMGDIQVGQRVIASNGNPTEVTGVFPQGEKRVYRVVFSDGAVVDCCEDHLWSVRTRHDKCEDRPYKAKSLKDLFGDLRLRDGENKWFVPLLEPRLIGSREFGNNYFTEIPLHPYVLGVLIGDGGIKHGVKLSSADQWIIDQTRFYLPEGVLVEYLENYDYQIVGGMNTPGKAHGFKKTNLIKQVLQDLGLFGLGSHEKFVPQMYLDADPASRLELLRGLMDTDGTANGSNKAAEFTSSSPRLAEDVCKLARSLGAATSVRIGDAYFRDKDGLLKKGKNRHRVTVNLGASLNPFDLPRKESIQGVGLEKGRNRSIDRIEIHGVEECQCISVSSMDSLYVVNDYVLTHNTVCAEMYLAHEIRELGGKGIYVGPLKALASEKEQDWTDEGHHFKDLGISIVTGDYRFTGRRIKELDKTDLVVMTPEMLASRCRNHTSDKSAFLYDVGTVVFDESHLLTVPKRGDHIEVALMKLAEINPNIRFVLLSATMPNVDEICGWTSKLTNRDTHFLESTYRPCPLNIHYETYWDGDKTYDAKEDCKIDQAINIVEYYPDDKFLVFVHTKRTGHQMVKELGRYGINAEFHNAELNKEKRRKLEDKFKNDKSFRVIVATSTLAWGLNLPARRVIVTGVHRGLSTVENYDIQQMVGRAGRPRFDPVGDAYILVPEREKKTWIDILREKPPIRSTLLDYVGKEDNPHYKTLAFHVVSEIHRGSIKTKEQFHIWFRKSLAHYQDHAFDDQVVDKTLDMLLRCRAIKLDDDEYKCTALGTIASMFYFSPFDVSALRRNFHSLFENHKEGDDFAISMAMGNTDTHMWSIANRYEKEQMDSYRIKIEKMYGENAFTTGAMKMGFAHFLMLKGKQNAPAFQGVMAGLRVDLERTMQVIGAIDSMASKWDKAPWLKTLKLRLTYGVAADMVELCQIPNVGTVRAGRLKRAGVRTLSDFLSYDEKDIMKFMKCSKKLAEEAAEGARLIELKESLDG